MSVSNSSTAIIAPVRYALATAIVLAALYGAYIVAKRIFLWLVLMWLFIWSSGCASVAQAATVPTCEAIAQAGAITVYYCQPDYGPPFYINSVGFMVLED